MKNTSLKQYYTGIESIDDVFGGISVGEVITIASSPGVGKTTLMMNITLNMVKRYNVPTLYNTLEMSKSDALLKLSSIQDISFYSIVKTNEDIRERNINKFNKKCYDLVIDNIRSLSGLKEAIDNMPNIKFIFIDYFELLENDISANELKKIAIDYKLIIFITSQLSKKEDSKPNLYDLNHSLDEVSDKVVFLYNRRLINDDIVVDVDIAKNRLGHTYTVSLLFISIPRQYKSYEKIKKKLYHMNSNNEKINYVLENYDILNGVNINEIKQIEEDIDGKIFVLKNDGKLYINKELFKKDIYMMYFLDAINIYGITYDNKVISLTNRNSNLSEYISNNGCKYKKIVHTIMCIACLTSDGDVRSISTDPEVGFLPERFQNVTDIGVIEGTDEIIVYHGFDSWESLYIHD